VPFFEEVERSLASSHDSFHHQLNSVSPCRRFMLRRATAICLLRNISE
jgi:hypothetical protein